MIRHRVAGLGSETDWPNLSSDTHARTDGGTRRVFISRESFLSSVRRPSWGVEKAEKFHTFATPSYFLLDLRLREKTILSPPIFFSVFPRGRGNSSRSYVPAERKYNTEINFSNLAFVYSSILWFEFMFSLTGYGEGDVMYIESPIFG